jgi:hypothetical protein
MIKNFKNGAGREYWVCGTEPGHQERRVGEHSACHLLARWFAELFFDPEDGGDTFLRNVGYKSTDYTASYPR